MNVFCASEPKLRAANTSMPPSFSAPPQPRQASAEDFTSERSSFLWAQITDVADSTKICSNFRDQIRRTYVP